MKTKTIGWDFSRCNFMAQLPLKRKLITKAIVPMLTPIIEDGKLQRITAKAARNTFRWNFSPNIKVKFLQI
ncbi:MAG: hypothetical protein WBJ36_01990 [Tenuifilum sp.]|uniref:hypothetical protein n=1 Tax=Tenuifilum sp. TaxID=2760880 RepID=UPI001B6D1E19|nr:hypothetical protein [Bacteroidales bacterium]HOK61285.1 hypothetical protein [Tenuifilum sp.]MBP9029971.1 hypothetical protein [Bacteroidales bacterium]HOK85799.1 hypothetical protein [Tenuifilum sp.]HON70864.1 hypothetical protein [Tenuifilum sp.]